jgi:hypothetical protein
MSGRYYAMRTRTRESVTPALLEERVPASESSGGELSLDLDSGSFPSLSTAVYISVPSIPCFRASNLGHGAVHPRRFRPSRLRLRRAYVATRHSTVPSARLHNHRCQSPPSSPSCHSVAILTRCAPAAAFRAAKPWHLAHEHLARRLHARAAALHSTPRSRQLAQWRSARSLRSTATRSHSAHALSSQRAKQYHRDSHLPSSHALASRQPAGGGDLQQLARQRHLRSQPRLPWPASRLVLSISLRASRHLASTRLLLPESSLLGSTVLSPSLSSPSTGSAATHSHGFRTLACVLMAARLSFSMKTLSYSPGLGRP